MKAHRLLYHSPLGSRVIQKENKFRRERIREGSRVVFSKSFRERVEKKRGRVVHVVVLEMTTVFDHRYVVKC